MIKHYEVADIFRQYGHQYRQSHNLSYNQHRAMRAIELCRTKKLGAHKETVCSSCGSIDISYNSCRNRHCPKCQFMRTQKWINDRTRDLLPVQYFHVVFTLPSELEPIILMNQEQMYNLLFKCVKETLTTLASDPKHLGAQTGFISALHTWDQKLREHTHMHCIVPGGGLSEDGLRWINTKKEDYFIPVHVLSAMYKKKFLANLKELIKNNRIKYGRGIDCPAKASQIIRKLYKKGWVVYAKQSFNGPDSVINYLSKYTHRIAISNYRIKDIKTGEVSFSWKDRTDNEKKKTMTITAEEFIRRFLLHILPHGFTKIRHYGILACKNRNTKLKKALELLGAHVVPKEELETINCVELILKKTGINICICRHCGIGKLITKNTFPAYAIIPP